MRKLHRTKDYKCNTVLVLCLVLLYQQNDMLHVVLFHVSSSCALCLDSLATLLSRPVLSCFGSIGVGICTLLSHKFWEHPWKSGVPLLLIISFVVLGLFTVMGCPWEMMGSAWSPRTSPSEHVHQLKTLSLL
ncbi:hypothetical protein F2Q68_00004003 [Brassica cretica]|uniref:Uncharacterized protein n=1 Tax=Brassica cretica TaxID=69181 RepID=A0A8S9JML8_BRACR|nr:hypothetical protein F2Q68_00004003 [Brassica cretica]